MRKGHDTVTQNCGDRKRRQDPGSQPRLSHSLMSGLQLREGQNHAKALRLETKSSKKDLHTANKLRLSCHI